MGTRTTKEQRPTSSPLASRRQNFSHLARHWLLGACFGDDKTRSSSVAILVGTSLRPHVDKCLCELQHRQSQSNTDYGCHLRRKLTTVTSLWDIADRTSIPASAAHVQNGNSESRARMKVDDAATTCPVPSNNCKHGHRHGWFVTDMRGPGALPTAGLNESTATATPHSSPTMVARRTRCSRMRGAAQSIEDRLTATPLRCGGANMTEDRIVTHARPPSIACFPSRRFLGNVTKHLQVGAAACSTERQVFSFGEPAN